MAGTETKLKEYIQMTESLKENLSDTENRLEVTRREAVVSVQKAITDTMEKSKVSAVGANHQKLKLSFRLKSKI